MAASPLRQQSRCPACGRPLNPNAEGEIPVICPQCGSWTDRPLERDSDSDEDRHLISAGTQQDDGHAYGVFGEKPLPPCPACGRPLPDDAGVCEQCNWHRDVGKVQPRTYSPIRQSWESGWSSRMRIAAFVACQLLNTSTALILVWKTGSWPTTTTGWIMISLMQAFVLGTYDRITLTRSTKGKVTLTKSWRVCFWPLAPKPIRWREYEGITVRISAAGAMEWLMFLILMPGIILPLLWWWYAIRPDHSTVALTQNLGDPVWILYAGTDNERAKEIAGAVHKLTELPCDPPV
jgi:hypothetical protein